MVHRFTSTESIIISEQGMVQSVPTNQQLRLKKSEEAAIKNLIQDNELSQTQSQKQILFISGALIKTTTVNPLSVACLKQTSNQWELHQEKDLVHLSTQVGVVML